MLNFKVKQFVKIIMQNIVFPFFYRIGKIAPVDDRLVIFADSHHDDVPYSMEDLYQWFETTDYKVLKLAKVYAAVYVVLCKGTVCVFV